MINLVNCCSKKIKAKFIGEAAPELKELTGAAAKSSGENIFRQHLCRKTKKAFFFSWERENREEKISI